MKLTREELQAMYPAPTESFTADMRRLIRQMPHKEEKHMRHIPMRLIIAAALILCLLTTTAFALSRPAVLDWLLGLSPAGDALTETVQEIHAEAKADGITIRVTSLVWDGSQFAFSYEAEADDPTQAALFRMDPVFTVNGQTAGVCYPHEQEMTMVPSTDLDVAPVQRNPVTCGQWSNPIEGLSGQVECTMTFRIYRPEKGFVFLIDAEDPLRHISEQSAEFQADLNDQLTAMQRLKNAVIPGIDQQDAAYWVEQGYTVEDENLVETAAVTLSFVFDADRVQTWDFSGVENVYLTDATVQAERFFLSPLKTVVDVRLIPHENTEDAALALAASHGAARLTDGDGEPVIFSEMDYEGDLSCYVAQLDGQWVCRYLAELPGLTDFPETVCLRTELGTLLRFDLDGE